MKAVDPTLTNAVIVGRIARNADPAGTAEQTGNGRINMPRALADTSTDPVQPAGADPVGQGGPFVGPYRAAATTTTVALTAGSNPSTYGASLSFTSTTQQGNNPVTTGTVEFRDGGNNCSQGQGAIVLSATAVNTSGQVTFTTSALAVGSPHTIRACYSDGSNGTRTQTVNARA